MRGLTIRKIPLTSFTTLCYDNRKGSKLHVFSDEDGVIAAIEVHENHTGIRDSAVFKSDLDEESVSFIEMFLDIEHIGREYITEFDIEVKFHNG